MKQKYSIKRRLINLRCSCVRINCCYCALLLLLLLFLLLLLPGHKHARVVLGRAGFRIRSPPQKGLWPLPKERAVPQTVCLQGGGRRVICRGEGGGYRKMFIRHNTTPVRIASLVLALALYSSTGARIFRIKSTFLCSSHNYECAQGSAGVYSRGMRGGGCLGKVLRTLLWP